MLTSTFLTGAAIGLAVTAIFSVMILRSDDHGSFLGSSRDWVKFFGELLLIGGAIGAFVGSLFSPVTMQIFIGYISVRALALVGYGIIRKK